MYPISRVERRDVVTMVIGSLRSFTIVVGVAEVWREPEKDKGNSQHLAQHPSTSGYLLGVDDVRGMTRWVDTVKARSMDGTRDEASDGSTKDESRRQALIAEYAEVCNNFQMLTEIRFRLLAFLPIGSAAAVVAALVAVMNTNIPQGMRLAVGFAISLFGLVATIGLATYNARNNQLYFDLVSRAAAIERSLNLPDGAFANRPGTWQRVVLPGGIEWEIDHGTAVTTIYGASISLWLFGAVVFVLDYCRRAYVAAGLNESSSPEDSWARMILIAVAILMAVAIPIVTTFWGGHQIMSQMKERRKKMGCLAWDAVKTAMNLTAEEDEERQEYIRRCAEDQLFIQRCKQLAICAQLSRSATDDYKKKIEKSVEARAKFYADPDIKRPGYYLPQDSETLSAAYLIGLLTDLSPLWIYDCGTNRKGDIPEEDCENIIRKIAERSVPVDTTTDTTQRATRSNGAQP
jgi:hypothetical protein